jgi:hypothetical protein
MVSRRRIRHGILHRLAQQAGWIDLGMETPLGQVRRPRGRPDKWSRVHLPFSDWYLDQRAFYREVLIRKGRKPKDADAFELMYRQMFPLLSEYRRRRRAIALAKRVAEFKRYAQSH